MWHPLELLSANTQWWLFVILILPSVLLLFRQAGLGRALRTADAPLGMLSLEMSLSSATSHQIIQSWSAESRERARQQLCADYWFIPAYTTVLALGALWVARWFSDHGSLRMATFLTYVAWVPWIVGLLEFASNSTLLRVLLMYPEIPGRLSRFAGWSARVKLGLIFLVVICGMLVVLGGLGQA
ncbi:MAG: hypothetical protein AAGF97_13890 [Planctomycetota bacterium]